MNWIKVEDRLPENGQVVLIYAGNYSQSQKLDIAKFNKGISIKEREQMKAGVLEYETNEYVHYDGHVNKPIYENIERWKIESGCDEGVGNNEVSYNWTNPPMQYFGQLVTHWCEIAPPNE